MCHCGKARRWLAAYRAEGSAGLSRRTRTDDGGHRMPDGPTRSDRGFGASPPAATRRCIGRCLWWAVEHGAVPSYEVVRRIIRGLDRGLLALTHHDGHVYRDGFELVLRRQSAHPNDLWQADHSELDVMVLDEAAGRRGHD